MLASHYYEGKIEAGCDEAGRGCLAGSVYAAAVILPDDYQNDLLNDSKQLTEKRRYQLREIIQRDAIAWAVGIVTPEEIDKINILNASILQAISANPSHHHRQGRRKVSLHRCSKHSCQDLPGRLHEPSRRGIPPIRLAVEQRLSHEKTPRGYQAIRHHALSP